MMLKASMFKTLSTVRDTAAAAAAAGLSLPSYLLAPSSFRLTHTTVAHLPPLSDELPCLSSCEKEVAQLQQQLEWEREARLQMGGSPEPTPDKAITDYRAGSASPTGGIELAEGIYIGTVRSPLRH